MKRFIAAFAIAAALGGCTTYSPAVPEGYDGPLAKVKDSVIAHSEQEADFFYLSAIGERTIENSHVATRQSNNGRGMQMTPVVLERDIPAREDRVTIVGRSDFAADILALINPVYKVEGDITFHPEANRVYVVKGVIRKDYSAVWIEDAESGEIAGEKVEINGSAELGFFGN